MELCLSGYINSKIIALKNVNKYSCDMWNIAPVFVWECCFKYLKVENYNLSTAISWV